MWLLSLLCACDLSHCSPPGSSVRGVFPGTNTGVGCHFLLQGIFPTQESNPRLCVSWTGRQLLYHCTTWKPLVYYNKSTVRRRNRTHVPWCLRSIPYSPQQKEFPIPSIIWTVKGEVTASAFRSHRVDCDFEDLGEQKAVAQKGKKKQ